METERPPRLRYFTPAEANAALPRLRELIEYASGCYGQVKQLVQTLRDPPPDVEVDELMGQVDQLRAEIARIIEHIHAEGVEVKGIEEPLLDFPAMYRGREVYLCWKAGENRITWWHPLETGISGRQVLDYADLGPWEWLN